MKRKPDDTDLSDTEWALLRPLIPTAKSGGRPRSVKIREILNAIFNRSAQRLCLATVTP